MVVTLSFLVLLSALVLGFFATTQFRQQVSNSGVSLARADFLARGAAEILVGELRAEMAATNASRIYGADGAEVADPNLAIPPVIYQPKAGTNGVPEKRGDLNSAWKNVVKRSSPSQGPTPLALYSGGRLLVSDSASASTATNSLNGRSVDDRIWRMPGLVADPAGDLSPRWCVVTRQGVRSVSDADVSQLKDPQSGQYALGRFAYVIYDVGGLIDINVVGNGLDSTNNATRGYLHQADLSGIPGVTEPAAFVSWRGGTSKASTNFLFSTTNSFFRVPVGDQRFVSRQDLIRYARANTNVINTNALPYLTTFTRELNAPSWWPNQNATDMGSVLVSSNAANYPNSDYRDKQNAPAVPNRFVPNVRRAASGTMTGYHTDGSAYTFEVGAGESLIQRRFPLGRLAWVGRNGPQNGGTTSPNGGNIQACFGLVWNDVDKRWIYAGPAGTTAQSSIATLAAVALQGRAPNFFELLQAGILNGSLGLTSFTSAPPLAVTKTAVTTDPLYMSPSVQVVQIGINLIDQYDADSFPTRILFAGSEIVGSENIPMINRLLFSVYRPTDPPLAPGDPAPDVARSVIKGWYEFELWNPYVGPMTDGPASYQIRLESASVLTDMRYQFDLDPASPPAPANPAPVQTAPGRKAGAALTISAVNLSGLASDPKTLDTLRSSGVSVTGSIADDTFTDATSSPAATYTGFYAGEWGGIATGNYPIRARPVISQTGTNAMNFVLYCQDANNPSGWTKVQTFSNPSQWGEVAFDPGGVLAAKFTEANRRYVSCTPVDPRTLRFGMGYVTKTQSLALSTDPFWDKTLVWNMTDLSEQYTQMKSATGLNFTPGLSTSASFEAKSNNHSRLADNRGTGLLTKNIVVPGSTTVTAYTDPIYRDRDGVQRYGDALWNPGNPTQGVFPMSPVASRPQDRPMILNRPFRSVGEMGYAFRDLPFKTIDFSTSRSADSALLDLFCINEGDVDSGISAGSVSLNSTNPEVLAAVLSGATRTDLDPANNRFSAAEAQTVAEALVAMTSGTNATQGPLLNRSDLATRFGENPAMIDVIKGRKEAVIRALAGTGQTRTWNLLIDVVAQAGKFTPTATTLNQFTVEGEQRYWLHVAIDRYTGEVLDQQFEAVKN